MLIGNARLVTVPPPYTDIRPIPHLIRDWQCCPGEIILVDVDATSTAMLPQLGQISRAIRTDFAVALALRLPAIHSAGSLNLVARAAAFGFRAVLTRDHDLSSTLHEQLAGVVSIADEVVEWLTFRGYVGSREMPMARDMCRAAERSNDMADLYRKLDMPERTARDRAARWKLPPPERWFQLLRLMRVQFDLIRDPALTLPRAAVSIGLANAQVLDNAVRRTFGVSAVRSRNLLGIEWRTEAWWHRAISTQPHTAAPCRVWCCRSQDTGSP